MSDRGTQRPSMGHYLAKTPRRTACEYHMNYYYLGDVWMMATKSSKLLGVQVHVVLS